MTDTQRVKVAIPSRATPTLAVRANTAADSLDISLSSFLALVGEGKMPRPAVIPGHPGLVLYDFEAVRDAWEALKESTNSNDAVNPFD
jgi:hypothetical protein